ncbi:hypothetical protein HPB49_013370 [Dermacentor silvarum]|uniref:Uncharacterized protein n=1 Tax=Dermacentor silvarum TaxID=543639 RepID=A0ACB8CXN2_DERSI|nr:hypothetical protein HPB49_013370 [Dermacentor silvarum]
MLTESVQGRVATGSSRSCAAESRDKRTERVTRDLSSSTARLLNLGTHNTFKELAEATLIAQLTRLSGAAAGRTLLYQLGIAPITHPTEAVPLLLDLYSHLVIPPIPKIMHPEQDGKHRATRAKALHKQYGDSSEIAYVDVAAYSSGSRMVLADATNQA